MNEINRDSPFDHFIITLFNLKNFLDGSNQELIWLNWTKDRINLFERYCLPSVVHQTNSNFKWLLYFDITTPSEIKNQVENWILQYAFIEIIYANSYNGFLDQYLHDLKNRSKSNWIVQTRFDNDDILHESAVDVIQSKIQFTDKTFVNLSSGYTYEKSTNYLSHYFYSMGPFLTLIEDKNLHMDGIYKVNHWQWHGLRLQILHEFLKKIKLKKDHVIFYLDKPMWIQFIHEKNMHNSSNRGLPVFRNVNLVEFHVPLKMKKSPLKRISSHVHYVWWKRYFKGSIVKIFS